MKYDRPQYLALLVRDMLTPVRCTCGRVYDLAKVEIIARYTDCSVWRCPGCKRQVDDRGETGWTSRKDYVRLDRGDLGSRLDMLGCTVWP